MAQSAISQHAAALSGALPAIPQQPTAGRAYPLPTPRPGFRLVPALIGTHRQSEVAHIWCPLWCVEDHMMSPSMLEDVTHTSKSEDLEIGSFLRRGSRLLMFAAVQSDPGEGNPLLKSAHIAVDSGDLPDYFTPDMADAFADDLIGFASQLRHLARTARLHNQAAAGSSSSALHVGGEAV